MPNDEDKKEEVMELTGSAMYAGRMAVREELEGKLSDQERIDSNVINRVMKEMGKDKIQHNDIFEKEVYSPGANKVKFSSGVRLEHVGSKGGLISSIGNSYRGSISESGATHQNEVNKVEASIDTDDKSKDIEVLINSFLYDKNGTFLLAKQIPSYVLLEHIGDTIYEDLKTIRVVKEGDDYHVITDKLYLTDKINTPGDIAHVIDKILTFGTLPEINKKLLLQVPSLFVLIK